MAVYKRGKVKTIKWAKYGILKNYAERKSKILPNEFSKFSGIKLANPMEWCYYEYANNSRRTTCNEKNSRY